MRQANLFMMSAAMLLAACGGTKDAGKTDQVLIEKSDIKIEGKRMTPEALWAMGRIGGFAVSPDGKKIAYTGSGQHHQVDSCLFKRGSASVVLIQFGIQ